MKSAGKWMDLFCFLKPCSLVSKIRILRDLHNIRSPASRCACAYLCLTLTRLLFVQMKRKTQGELLKPLT